MGNASHSQLPLGSSDYDLTLRSDSQSAREKQERQRATFPPGLRNISYDVGRATICLRARICRWLLNWRHRRWRDRCRRYRGRWDRRWWNGRRRNWCGWRRCWRDGRIGRRQNWFCRYCCRCGRFGRNLCGRQGHGSHFCGCRSGRLRNHNRCYIGHNFRRGSFAAAAINRRFARRGRPVTAVFGDWRFVGSGSLIHWRLRFWRGRFRR